MKLLQRPRLKPLRGRCMHCDMPLMPERRDTFWCRLRVDPPSPAPSTCELKWRAALLLWELEHRTKDTELRMPA